MVHQEDFSGSLGGSLKTTKLTMMHLVDFSGLHLVDFSAPLLAH